jgi:hypothetical protein
MPGPEIKEFAMNCTQFEERIPEFLSDMMDTAGRLAMEEHRDRCPECAKVLKLHEFVMCALDTAEPVKAPAGLTERILAAAAAEEALARPKFFRLRTLIPAAAAFVLIFGALGRLGAFIFGAPGVRDMSESVAMNWNLLYEWPLLLKAWSLGLLGQPWVQSLLEPVHFTALSLSIPLYFFVLYAGLLGVLALYARSYFRPATTTAGY